MDGWTDRQRDIQHEIIIPCHYRVVGYKKETMLANRTLDPLHLNPFKNDEEVLFVSLSNLV